MPPEHWEAILGDREGNLWIRSLTQVRVRRVGSPIFVESVATPRISMTERYRVATFGSSRASDRAHGIGIAATPWRGLGAYRR